MIRVGRKAEWSTPFLHDYKRKEGRVVNSFPSCLEEEARQSSQLLSFVIRGGRKAGQLTLFPHERYLREGRKGRVASNFLT
jgi:hypothetical protein